MLDFSIDYSHSVPVLSMRRARGRIMMRLLILLKASGQIIIQNGDSERIVLMNYKRFNKLIHHENRPRKPTNLDHHQLMTDDWEFGKTG